MIVDINDGIDGQDFSSLASTTNIQGDYSRNNDGRFIHIEFYGDIRELSSDLSDKAVDALINTINNSTSAQPQNQLTSDELNDFYENENAPRIVAHINGNHFVVIESITDDTITYKDMGIGKDGENESLTISKEAFEDMWEGNVFVDSVIAEAAVIADKVTQSQILSVQETMEIRGAFWGSLLNIIAFAVSIIAAPLTAGTSLAIFLNTVVIGLRIAAFAVSLVEGDWISAISSIVSLSFETSFLGDIFKGITDVLGPIGQLLQGIVDITSNIFDAVSGFFQPIIKGLGGFLTPAFGEAAAKIAESAVMMGVNYAVAYGMDAMGIDPAISGLVGSLVAGAIIGGTKSDVIDPKTNVVIRSTSDYVRQNILQTILINDVGRLGLELDLDPIFTNIIGLASGSLLGNINTGTTTLEKAFNTIKPELISSLAEWGMIELGDSLGLDSRISNIIGTTIGSGIGGLFEEGANIGTNLVNLVNDSIRNSVIAISTQFIMDELLPTDSLLGSFMSNVLVTAFNSALSNHGPPNIIDAITNTIVTAGRRLLDPITLSDFVQYATQNGIANAFEVYGTSILTRGTIEGIYSSLGTIYDNIGEFIQERLDNAIVIDGNLKEAELTDDLKLRFDDENGEYRLTGILEGDDAISLFESESGLLGEIENYYDEDTTLVDIVNAYGNITRREIRDKSTSNVLIEIAPGTENQYGSIRNFVLGTNIVLNQNDVVELTILSNDFEFDWTSLEGFGDEAIRSLAARSLSTKTLTFDEAVRIANGATHGKDSSILFSERVAYAFEERASWDADEMPPTGKYALKILAKRPDGNDTGDSKIGSNVGHAFVAVVNANRELQQFGRYPTPNFFYSDPTPGQFTFDDIIRYKDIFIDDSAPYQSTGPNDPWAFLDGKQGFINNDLGHDWDEQTNWVEITADQYNAIMQYKAQDQVYNLRNDNCAGFALEVAQIGGIDINYDPWVYPNPQDLADAIEKARQQ